jgi:light-harvesting complex II chlorophyll a/b binding protein 4
MHAAETFVTLISRPRPTPNPHPTTARVNAAKVELAGAPNYWGQELPWSISTAAVFNSLLMGGVEVFRNSELDPERRAYPGGYFDPLNFADEANPERAFQLKTAEIKHGRLAMVAALGFAVQAGTQGQGALGSLKAFGGSF